MTPKKKLIEVALPLEAINKASAREKSIRHGHPSTLHLWWARRPLAAARAVIFAQMVDDPSAHPDLFPTEKKQEKERQRLFRIIEDLVLWENTTNETVLQAGARRDLAELAARLRRERRPSAGEGAVRPAQAARLPRPLRRRRGAAAGGAAAGARELRQRPEPGGGADQQGDDRDPAEVRGQAAGEPRGARGQDAHRAGVEGRAGARRGRALLRPVDARRGREAHRPPLPEGRGHGRDGEGAAGPEAVRRPEAHRDRLALGAHGEEPEPGLRAGGRAARLDLHALHQGGQGGVRRAGDRGRRLPLHGEGGEAEGCGGGEERHQAGARRELPVPDVGRADRGRLHQGRGQGRAHGRAADGDRRRGRARAGLSRADAGAWRRLRARRSRTWKPEVDDLRQHAVSRREATTG